MKEQKDLLEITVSGWISSGEQIYEITIMGR
jgi:hypothetical protein